MAYEKRLCVLKQIKKGFSVDGSVLSGAVYAERTGQEVVITPKIASLAPLREGRYALAIWLAGKSYCFELKGNDPLRIPESGSIKGGFSALVCFVRGEAEPLAYGFCGGAPSEYGELMRLFEKKEKPREGKEHEDCFRGGNEEAVIAEKRKCEQKFERKPEPESESGPKCDTEPQNGDTGLGNGGTVPKRYADESEYDDEAIADSDYYGGIWEALEDAGADSQTKSKKTAAGDCSCTNEANTIVHPFAIPRGGLTYYNEIAPKLKEAMEKYPKDENLMETFPNSEWVRAENALLGIIYAEGLPRYLCVAMKTEPPKEVEEYCIFVPESPYTETEGYFVVFQDADSGEYVRVEKA